MGHEPNVAVLESNLRNLEKQFDQLFEMQQGQVQTTNNLIRLNDQAIQRIKYLEDDMSDVKKETQRLSGISREQKGGYTLLLMLGSFLVGASVVGGVIWQMTH